MMTAEKPDEADALHGQYGKSESNQICLEITYSYFSQVYITEY